MSHLLKIYNGYEGKYEPYVWISKSKKIKWTSLYVNNKPIGGLTIGNFQCHKCNFWCFKIIILGSIVSIKGMLFYFLENSHTHLQFSYQLKIIEEKEMEFKQYSTNGWDKCKEFSKDENCLKVSTFCKNPHSNEKVLPITYYKFH